MQSIGRSGASEDGPGRDRERGQEAASAELLAHHLTRSVSDGPRVASQTPVQARASSSKKLSGTAWELALDVPPSRTAPPHKKCSSWRSATSQKQCHFSWLAVVVFQEWNVFVPQLVSKVSDSVGAALVKPCVSWQGLVDILHHGT